VYGYGLFPAMRNAQRYDAVVYQIGNSPFHDAIHDALERYPGVTVMHDAVLHHFYRARTLGQRDTAGYVRSVAYEAGSAGAIAAAAAMTGGRAYPCYEYPLHERVVDASRVILVHSDYAARAIMASRPAATVLRAPLICDPRAQALDPARTAILRARWEIPDDAFVIASFGQIDENRHLDAILKALNAVRQRFHRAMVLLVGEPVPKYGLEARLKASGQGTHVRATGRVPLEDFFAAFDLADVAVNLRDPTAGETSATAIQLLGRGVPLIVSAAGAYAELPDVAAIKVATGAGQTEQLVRALLALASAGDMRNAMRDAARTYVAAAHRPEQAVAAYLRAIEMGAQRQSRAPRRAASDLAAVLGDLGTRATDDVGVATAQAALDLGMT
jgi:glycosyltransferase involved in cell wall biosynthesis